jgi:hypothetical protein
MGPLRAMLARLSSFFGNARRFALSRTRSRVNKAWLAGTTKTWRLFRLQRSLQTEDNDANGTTVAIGETNRLISSDIVVGTSVYNLKGEHLGSIYGMMVDKISGQVACAVMSFGGFLGIGESYHPLPWRMLKYDVRQNGYV